LSIKWKNFWLAFLPPILILAVQNIMALAGSGIVFGIKAVSFHGKNLTELYKSYTSTITSPAFSSVVLLIYAVIAIAIFAPWWSKKRVAFDSRRMSFRGFKPLLLIFGIILFVVGAQVASNYLVNCLSALFPKELIKYSKIMKNAGLDRAGATPVIIIYAGFVGPVAEEFAFRGLSLGYFKKSLPSFAAANILQALLFAVIHLNFIQGVYAFIIGLLLGYVAYRTGSLLLSMVLHICFNSTSFILQILTPKAMNGGAFLAFAILVLSMMAVYAGIFMLIGSQPMAKEK